MYHFQRAAGKIVPVTSLVIPPAPQLRGRLRCKTLLIGIRTRRRVPLRDGDILIGVFRQHKALPQFFGGHKARADQLAPAPDQRADPKHLAARGECEAEDFGTDSAPTSRQTPSSETSRIMHSIHGASGAGIRNPGLSADSDDLARVYRFNLAQDSEMISPTIPI